MTDKQAKLDDGMERIAAAIDRASSVPVSVQLRGALEFGIASGDLASGLRLPSVRAFAARLGLSPVTVSNVYAALQTAGHIEGRVGSGTFVAGGGTRVRAADMRALEDRIADLIEAGRACGLTRTELSLRVSMAPARRRRHMRIVMVGNFLEATEAYAAELRRYMRDGDRVEAATLDLLKAMPQDGIDMIAAPKTLLPDIRNALPGKPVAGVTLIPNEATRIALASVAPDARVAGYSYFPGFVAIMKSGILRFAPQVSDLTMVVRGETGEAATISRADVLIYATGADYLRDTLLPGQTAFEYRHIPEPKAVRSELLPAIEACRATLAAVDTKEDAT